MRDEPGSDELLRQQGAMDDVALRRAEDVERERAEEARTTVAPEVDDGGRALVEP